jgi:antitoxin (DNA-binding transcriptional repressor) of toxin-antitoxin stability system
MRSFAIENIPLSVAGTALALRVERGRTYVLTDRGIAIADR